EDDLFLKWCCEVVCYFVVKIQAEGISSSTQRDALGDLFILRTRTARSIIGKIGTDVNFAFTIRGVLQNGDLEDLGTTCAFTVSITVLTSKVCRKLDQTYRKIQNGKACLKSILVTQAVGNRRQKQSLFGKKQSSDFFSKNSA